MAEYTFKWKECEQKSVTVSSDDIEGADVWYQPTNSDGRIVKKNGLLFIEWSDAPDTLLNSDRGKEIISECNIF